MHKTCGSVGLFENEICMYWALNKTKHSQIWKRLHVDEGENPPNNFDLIFDDLDLWTWSLTLMTFAFYLLFDSHLNMHDLELWPSNLTVDLGDLDLWAPFLIVGWKTQFLCLTLTFKSVSAEVKVNPLTKNQGRRSNGLVVRVQTDRQTETRDR